MDTPDTASPAYTARMVRETDSGWKKFVDVQAPYKWNLRRLKLGRVLDVGCGIGRNLKHLGPASVGVDHNPTSVAHCRANRMDAHVPDEFMRTFELGSFDSLLLSHIVEHMPETEAIGLVRQYAPFIGPNGRAVLITPQELLYSLDKTHVWFIDFDDQRRIVEAANMTVEKQYSFPFPRAFGKLFRYAEFVTVARLNP